MFKVSSGILEHVVRYNNEHFTQCSANLPNFDLRPGLSGCLKDIHREHHFHPADAVGSDLANFWPRPTKSNMQQEHYVTLKGNCPLVILMAHGLW